MTVSRHGVRKGAIAGGGVCVTMDLGVCWALSREYQYRVCAAPTVPDPLRRHDTLAWERPLSISLLQQASDLLLGDHEVVAAGCVHSLLKVRWVTPLSAASAVTV